MANYHYLSLTQAWGTNEKLLNIYGVITRVDIPRPCNRGTDYKQRVWVTDQSARDINFGNNINDDENQGNQSKDVMIMFFGDRDMLLTNTREGDIIRIHRLEKGEWQKRPQFVAKIGIIRGGSGAGGLARCHFCLFRGYAQTPAEEPLPEEPYQTSSVKYTFNVTDRQNVKTLRTFIGQSSFREVALDNPFTVAISHILQNDPTKVNNADQYDLHCRVLEVKVFPDGRVILVVWDGSDNKPFPPELTNNGGGGYDESQQSQDGASNSLQQYPSFFWSPFEAADNVTPESLKQYETQELGFPVPKLGSAFPVVMRNFDVKAEDLPTKGSWIRFMKLSSWVRNGQRQGLFTQHSSWAPSQPNPSFQEAYADRLSKRDVTMWAPDAIASEGREGNMRALTTTQFGNVPLSTLREVLMSPAPGRFRVAVRVVGHAPKDVHDFCTQDVANLSQNGAAEWGFNLSLALEDATGRLDVRLAPPESDQFFHGIPPCDLWESSTTYDRVLAKMKALVSHDIAQPRQGWITVCIMSYLIPDGNSKKKKAPVKRCFQIFGTSAIG